MKAIKLGDKYLLRFDKGEEVVSCLKKFAEDNSIKLANVNAIGATNKVKVGLFDVKTKEYHAEVIEGIFEITSLMGTISTMNEEIYLHLHINFADENFHTYGGHLNECYVSATCEMVLDTISGQIDRKLSEEIGLNLFEF